jgi:hypothetical protein
MLAVPDVAESQIEISSRASSTRSSSAIGIELSELYWERPKAQQSAH